MDLEKQLVIHGPDKFELIDESETGNYKLVKAKAKDGDRYVIVDAKITLWGPSGAGDISQRASQSEIFIILRLIRQNGYLKRSTGINKDCSRSYHMPRCKLGMF